MNNPRAFRAAHASLDNTSFPAVFPQDGTDSVYGNSGKEFVERLKQASQNRFEQDVVYPELAESVRAKHAIDNPIAYVNECKRIINHVLSILFGLPPEHFFAEADGESSRKTKFF